MQWVLWFVDIWGWGDSKCNEFPVDIFLSQDGILSRSVKYSIKKWGIVYQEVRAIPLRSEKFAENWERRRDQIESLSLFQNNLYSDSGCSKLKLSKLKWIGSQDPGEKYRTVFIQSQPGSECLITLLLWQRKSG